MYNKTTRTPICMFYQTVFLVVVFFGLIVAISKSSEFVAIKSRDGKDFCAVDVPTAVQWYPAHGSDVHCGLQCQRRIDCKAFNFKSLLGKCDQYEKTPTNFSVIPGCTGYAIENINKCMLDNGGCAANAACSRNGTDVKCSCAYGWKLNRDGRSCASCSFDSIPATNMYIKIIPGGLSWFDAAKRCLDYCPSSHLAVFRSQQEFDSLIQYMNTTGEGVKLPCGTPLGSGFWTAKRRLNTTTTTQAECFQSPFVWDTNETTDGLLKEQSWESSLWAQGEPNCYPSPHGTDSCVTLFARLTKLNDAKCYFSACSLCQLDAV